MFCSALSTWWLFCSFSIVGNILHGHDPEGEAPVTQAADVASARTQAMSRSRSSKPELLDTSNGIETKYRSIADGTRAETRTGRLSFDGAFSLGARLS
jgi:hypothetical protein